MKIHYRIKNNAIEIVRCYGTDDRIVLPEEINGLPVVSAAPYAFSAHKDEKKMQKPGRAKTHFHSGKRDFLPGRKCRRLFSRIR